MTTRPGTGRARWVRRCLTALCMGAAAVALTAGPAWAHAELESSSPSADEVLERSPSAVSLAFDEGVGISPSSVQVFDGRGERVATSSPEHAGGADDRVRVSLPVLDDGSYVVTWRIVSEDAHPTRGAFTFQIGPDAAAGLRKGLVSRLLTEQGGSHLVGVLFGVARLLLFVGLALLLGGACFVLAVWPAGRTSARARALAWGGWWLASAATIASFLLQGPYASASPLSDVLRSTLIGDVFDSRYGQVQVVRAGLLAVAAVVLAAVFARNAPARRPARASIVAGVVGTALAATPALAGHASTGDLAVGAAIADTVHVAAMATWLGGLVILVGVVLPRRDVEESTIVATRTSRVAFACVVALVASGAFQSWRDVRTLDALRNSDYGNVLLVKLAVFALLLLVAAASRRIVRYDLGPEAPPFDDEPDPTRALATLGRRVRLEVAVAVAVLAVTAVLVNTQPGVTASYAPVELTLQSPNLWVDVVVTPGKAGRNGVHLYALDPNGGPLALTGDLDDPPMRATLALSSRDIGPIEVPLRRLSPSHSYAPSVNIPIRGTWQLTVRALVSPTNEVTLTADVPVG